MKNWRHRGGLLNVLMVLMLLFAFTALVNERDPLGDPSLWICLGLAAVLFVSIDWSKGGTG